MHKVLIATGGTGGHIYPAIAIGEYLKDNGIQVIFTGRKNSMEEKLIREQGFHFIYIKAKRFKGINFINKILSVSMMFYLILSCLKILKKEKVDYIIGTGGYVSAPIVFAAVLKKVKTGICEQNSLMGFGNRILSLFVNDVFISFQKTLLIPCKYKSICTGNFIRKNFNKKRKEKGILVFGGSQGAVKVNEIICSILHELAEIDKIKIFHITGEKDFERIRKIYENHTNLEYEIYPYYNDIYKIFEKIDLVIGRAGATSISEIYYSEKKAILIPYPFAADNHQWYNALEFCKSGKGVILKENNLSKTNLLKWIKFFIENEYRFESNYKVLGDFEEGKKIILKKILGYSYASETENKEINKDIKNVSKK